MATLRIEYIGDNGHLCSVECFDSDIEHSDPLSIQMALCHMAGQIIHGLAEQISCGADDRPDCRGILGAK